MAASCTVFEVNPPPAANGLNTVTAKFAGVAISLAKIIAVNFSALTNTVGRLLPLICTTEFVRKLLPVTVSVKLGPPTVTEIGLILLITGAVCAGANAHSEIHRIAIHIRSKL